MASANHFGDVANIAQLTGIDAVRLIGMIVKAAATARMHKKNCRQFAQHLKLIGNLLEQLKITELKRYPETREPLEQLEDALRRSYILVNSCQDRSYLYLLAMGWNIVYQFRRAQNEIDQYLKIIPLITLVDNARVRSIEETSMKQRYSLQPSYRKQELHQLSQERLEYIEMDQREYTLEVEDMKMQEVIMKPEPSKDDTIILTKNLSCSYPRVPINEAIQKENEKLQLELQHSQANLDVGQCEFIQHLLDVTEVVATNTLSLKNSPAKPLKKLDQSYSNVDNEKIYYDDYAKNDEKLSTSRNTSSVKSRHDLLSSKGSHRYEEWHSDLLGCCSEPLLCIKTLFFPCGTFSRVASVAADRHISSADACNELMAYSLILSCCCYTCCIRKKLRKKLNIRGGCVDDFLSHLMCCCCALVQELREVKIRGTGIEKTKISPPTTQFMES